MQSGTLNPILPWLGALAGYLVVMRTNPVRGNLRDGLRTVRRYPRLWGLLGSFGFAYALFQLGVRVYFAGALPAGERPLFLWARSAYRPGWQWFYGLQDSLWYLPSREFRESARQALLPALDSTAGLFNSLAATFPISAIVAALLLLNWGGYQGEMLRALRRRFGGWGWLAHFAILICAVAAMLKPLIYALPQFVDGRLWYQWAPVGVWLGFLFEYLFGVCVQVYLILLAYCWVRGLSVNRTRLRAFAIRRSSFVIRWAAIVMILSTVFIDFPLILKNFEAFARWFPNDPEVFDRRVGVARAVIDDVLLFCATAQIILVFHSESLRKALIDHARFLRRNGWSFVWMVVVAALHFYLAHWLDLACIRAFGEGTALWVAWTLAFPWVAAAVGAWLLASWVSVYKRCASGGSAGENWTPF